VGTKPDPERATEDLAAAGSEQAGRAESGQPLVTLARPEELVPGEIRDVSFGSALRGYDRGDVDAYVERVNRVIAELEIGSSPQNAVRSALDRVGEQTAGILQQAREAAEALAADAQSESEHLSRRARVEASEVLEAAQERARELLDRSAAEAHEMLADARQTLETIEAQTARAREERRRVLDQLRATAAALEALALAAERESGEEAGESTAVLDSVERDDGGDDRTSEPGGERPDA